MIIWLWCKLIRFLRRFTCREPSQCSKAAHPGTTWLGKVISRDHPSSFSSNTMTDRTISSSWPGAPTLTKELTPTRQLASTSIGPLSEWTGKPMSWRLMATNKPYHQSKNSNGAVILGILLRSRSGRKTILVTENSTQPFWSSTTSSSHSPNCLSRFRLTLTNITSQLHRSDKPISTHTQFPSRTDWKATTKVTGMRRLHTIWEVPISFML